MSKSSQFQNHPETPLIYQIKIEGHLPVQWAEWFGDADICCEEDGNTLLTCKVVDQAALHGLLKKVRDLGLTLLSVRRVPANMENPTSGKEHGP